MQALEMLSHRHSEKKDVGYLSSDREGLGVEGIHALESEDLPPKPL